MKLMGRTDVHSGYVFVAAVTRDGEAGGGATRPRRHDQLQPATAAVAAGSGGGVGATSPDGIAWPGRHAGAAAPIPHCGMLGMTGTATALAS